jgi:hypothetical protein
MTTQVDQWTVFATKRMTEREQREEKRRRARQKANENAASPDSGKKSNSTIWASADERTNEGGNRHKQLQQATKAWAGAVKRRKSNI